MAEVKKGDKVTFLRSADKAVRLAGEVIKVDGNQVDIRLDTEHEAYETAHIDDVTVVEAAKKKAKSAD